MFMNIIIFMYVLTSVFCFVTFRLLAIFLQKNNVVKKRTYGKVLPMIFSLLLSFVPIVNFVFWIVAIKILGMNENQLMDYKNKLNS